MKKFLAISLAALMALSLVACGGSSSSAAPASSTPAASSAAASSAASSSEAVPAGKLEEHTVEAIKAKGVLTIATESQYAPFAFKDLDGNIIGLEPKLMQALADDLGVKLEIMDIEFTAVIPAVQSGAADIAMAGLTPTAERKESVDMSDFYNNGGQAMLVKATDIDKYTDAASLKDLPIAAQKGALQQTIAESQFADSKLTLLPKVPQAVQELKAGNVVAVLVDAISAEQYVKQNSDLAVAKVEVVVDPTEAGSSAAVMKGNTDLMDYLNAEIKKYKDSGDLDKWFVEAKAQAEEMGLD